MLEDEFAAMELDMQEELMCLLSMSFPRSEMRNKFQHLMTQTVRDVFTKHTPRMHRLTDHLIVPAKPRCKARTKKQLHT